MKALAVVIGSVLALIGFTVTLGGAAWSASDNPSAPVITFDDAAHQVQLTIPTPACPASQPTCQWKFFLNEPKLHVDVATVYGTSGTLTIPYPKEFCGVIQADAYVGPPWVAKRGFQHTIDDCPPTTTTTAPPTTTTTPPSSTTTTAPPPTTTTTEPPAVPGTVIATAAPPPGPTPPAPVAAPVTAAPALTQLPFTGRNIKPLIYLGVTLAVLGLALLVSNETWRRMLRRLTAASARGSSGPGRPRSWSAMVRHVLGSLSAMVDRLAFAAGTMVWSVSRVAVPQRLALALLVADGSPGITDRRRRGGLSPPAPVRRYSGIQSTLF